jgi:hypothetical protein
VTSDLDPSAIQLERVRTISHALPHVTERTSHGSATFFIRDKPSFATFVDDHHGDGILGIWCAAPPGEQEARIDQDSVRFFRPPYVGGRGWLGVRLDHDVSDDELEEILTEAWRAVAPKRMLADFDADGS